MFQTFKASFGDDTFSGLLRLKHLGVRIITCGLIEGGLTYLITIAETCRQVWCHIYIFLLSEIDLHSGLCTRAVQRVLTHWKFYPHNFPSALQGRRNQQEERVRLITVLRPKRRK